MPASVKKDKRGRKVPEGKVVIGKNIPFHWGQRQLVDWEICGRNSLACYTQVLCKTKEEALAEYQRKKDFYDTYCPAPVVIVPEYKHEGAIMNPRVRAWKEAIDPATGENAGME